MSMLRHATLDAPARPVTLLYGARTEHDLAFRDELAAIGRRNPQVRVIFALSGGTSDPRMYPGRVDAELLRTVPDIAHAIALICGPQAMIDQTVGLLGKLGVAQRQIRFERFDTVVAASSRSRAAAPHSVAPASATFQLEEVRSGRRGAIAPGQTLLDAAERHGIDIPSICRAGVCATCRTRVVEGHVDCTSDLLSEDDRQNGYVLACVSTARSDCVIEAEP
jgi:ferredoxin-NADP reductase